MKDATDILPRIGFALRLTALPDFLGPPREAVVGDGEMDSRTVEDAGGGVPRPGLFQKRLGLLPAQTRELRGVDAADLDLSLHNAFDPSVPC